MSHVGVELADLDRPVADLGDDRAEQIRLGDFSQDGVVLPAEVVAVIGQASKTNC